MEMQSLLIESKNDYSMTTFVSGNSGAKVGVVMTLAEEYALGLLELAKSTSLRGGMVGVSNRDNTDQRMEMQSLLTESKNDYSKTTSVSGNSGVKVGVVMTFAEEYALELLELAKSMSLRGGMVGGSNEEDSDQRMEMQSLLTESKNDYSKTTSVSGNSGAKVGVVMTFAEEI